VSDSATIRLDSRVKDRLDALAAARGIDPGDLLAELVLEAETAQLVTDVNRELEHLSQGQAERRRQAARMRHLEATVSAWIGE
jgi:predicted transcriptional regulator